MFDSRRITLWGLACVIVLIGCDPQSMPKGAGASGKASVAGLKPERDAGLELINRLTDPADQRGFDWLHQPFDKAVTLNDPTDPDLIKRLQADWDKYRFGDIVQGKRYTYLLTIETSVGPLTIVLAEAGAPNLCRNMMALSELNAFEGKKFQLSNGIAVADAASEPPPYTLLPQNEVFVGVPPTIGMLVAFVKDGSVEGTRFGIVLQDGLESTGQWCGVGFSRRGDTAAGKLGEALKNDPDSVTIGKTSFVAPSPRPLFQADGKLDLPPIDEAGNLDLPGL